MPPIVPGRTGLRRALLATACPGLALAVLSGHGTRTAQALKPCALPGLDVPARCGSVHVAEVAETPQERRIAIRVVVVPAISATPLRDAVLVLAGGPGQGAAALAGPLTRRVGSLREQRDLIFVDQRGTGASNPLSCPQGAHPAQLMGRMFDPAALQACRDQLAQRADLRQYGTSRAAADHEAVLDALGYRQVNVWAVSYGTRLALELARRVPQRIRTMTLEGAVPPFFAWPTSGARDLDTALNALVADCEADAGCAARYPEFRRDVETAFARLAGRSITIDVFDPRPRQSARVGFSSSDLAYAVRGMLYGPEALHLPAWFRAAAAGRFDAFAQAYVTRARALDVQVATGVHLGVYCSEDLPLVDLRAARKLAAQTRIGTYLLDEYAAACEVWPRGVVPQDFQEPVRSDVPTLLMAGRRDPVTPPWSAEAVARTLTRARVLTWHAGGHGFDGLASPTCKNSIVADFVSSARPDRVATACMSRERKSPFAHN